MMQINRAAILAALVLLVACQLNGRLVSASNSVRILDESDPLDVEAIARVMCEPSASRHRQISRLSTVDKLIEFFEHQVGGESHALFACKQQHGEALRRLREVLNVSKENVCSEKKLALIEEFHNEFVSRHVERKKGRQEKERDAAPKLLRVFFMQFAMEVDARCKRHLIKNLEWDLEQKFGEDINEKLFRPESTNQPEDVAFGAVFKSAMQKFTDLYPVKKYEDVLMVWDVLENSYLSQKMDADAAALRDPLDSLTGEPVRMLVRVKTARYLNRLREHCHYNFKPIYSKLILPIIKLADLGYSNYGEQFKFELKELKANEQVKRWYSVTQLCEAMLPVKYYEDPTLGAKDVVIMTKLEAAELDEAAGEQASVAEPRTKLVYEPETNSMLGLDRLDLVMTVDAKKLVKSVRSNLEARARAIGRVVVRFARNLKSSFKRSRVGRIFFSKPIQCQLAPKPAGQFVDEEVGQQLDTLLESMTEQELESSSPPRMLRPADMDSVKRRVSKKQDKTWAEIGGDCAGIWSAMRYKMRLLPMIIISIVIGTAIGVIIATVTG